MANGLYGYGKAEILRGNIDLENDTIKAILTDSADYTVNLSTHQDLADVAAGARVSTVTLTITVSDSGGTATVDATDATFTSVTGDQSEAIVIYKDSGVEATSTLIAYIDTFNSGMPVTPDGGDIDWTIDASGIFDW